MNEDNQALMDYYLERADETLKDAKSLAGDAAWNSAMNRLYYACFYAVQAVLIQRITVTAKTHSGIRNLFNLHLVKAGFISSELSSFYSLLMQRRGESDYAAFEKLADEDVLPHIPQAEEFINAIKKVIRKG